MTRPGIVLSPPNYIVNMMASHVTVSIVRLCYPNSAVVTVSLAAVFSQKRLRGKLSDTNTDSEIS